MKNIKIIFVTITCLLIATTARVASPITSVTERRYDYAVEAFEAAQRAEESARLHLYLADKADYYQTALKNYKLALKEAQRSIEESEQLSRREKYDREHMIDECREKIDICEERYGQAAANLNFEELKRKAYKYVIAGFNYAIADDKSSAKRSWDEAMRLYKKALTYTKDPAEQEIIKSKIQEIIHYIESYL